MRRAGRLARAVALAAVVLASCERAAPTAPPLPELRPVVATAIADLEARVASERPDASAAGEPLAPEQLERRMGGLVEFVRNAGGRARNAGFEDLVASPPEATAWLARLALDEQAAEPDRHIAIEALERRAGRTDALALLDVAERARVASLRASAAWRLGRLPHDEVLPRLVLRLRYETDWECVLWIGQALCQHGLFGGLDAMATVAESAPDEALRARAAAEAEAVAEAVALEPPADARMLRWLWASGDLASRLPVPKRSLAYQLELWRWTLRLDEYQLRGVDDCRFLMARLDRFAADVLAAALYDESRHVRLGAAQCLARMGPRARDAGPALEAQLADPALGAWMAAALGNVGYPPARLALEQRLDAAHPLELRVAAARALGRIGLAESVPALLAAFEAVGDDGQPELRQALAESLVYCGAPDAALAVLADALVDPALEPSTSAAALRHHLAREAVAEVPGAQERLAAWDALGTRVVPAVPGAAEEGAPSTPESSAARAALARELFGAATD